MVMDTHRLRPNRLAVYRLFSAGPDLNGSQEDLDSEIEGQVAEVVMNDLLEAKYNRLDKVRLERESQT